MGRIGTRSNDSTRHLLTPPGGSEQEPVYSELNSVYSEQNPVYSELNSVLQ